MHVTTEAVIEQSSEGYIFSQKPDLSHANIEFAHNAKVTCYTART